MSRIPLAALTEYLLAAKNMFLLPSALFLCFTPLLIASTHSDAWAGGPAPTFEIDLKELDKLKGAAIKKPAAPPKTSAPKQTNTDPESSQRHQDTVVYTVKQGDNLFKILMRDFGMSNRESELRIPELVRINNLTSSISLPVGKKLIIPAERQVKKASRSSSPPEKHLAAQRHQEESKPEPKKPEPPVALAETFAPTPAVKPALSVRSIPGSVQDQTLDLFLTAINVPWTRNRVIEGSAGHGSAESFSIKVERYLELDGRKYVLTGSAMNPYDYTIIRLLELAGYTVIRLDEQSAVSSFAPQLLTQLGFAFSAGKHRFTPPATPDAPRIIEGFLVTLKLSKSLVFITETPLDAVSAENLALSSVEPFTADSGAAPPEQ